MAYFTDLVDSFNLERFMVFECIILLAKFNSNNFVFRMLQGLIYALSSF